MDYSNITVDECGALANAIVLQAIDDYEKAIAVLATEYHPETLKQEEKIAMEKMRASKMKNDCERFFASAWYSALTTIQPKVIKHGIIDGICNARPVIYNDEKKCYLCDCKSKLPVKKGEKGSPILKCRVCKKYWRAFGEPLEVKE